MKEQIIKILNEWREKFREVKGDSITFAIHENSFDNIADEIVKLIQCKNILEKVKKAWTPDKRSFEEAEKDKIMKGCLSCKYDGKSPYITLCSTCCDYDKWKPIKTE